MSADLENEECQIVAELSKYMKANSKTNIISCLTRIKADSKCQKQFTKGGGLYSLIGLLRFQNLEVLNSVLSLLANMCLSREVKEELRDTKVANYTLWIIRNLKLGNNLHCRACRLIGNLSECSWHAKSFFDAGAVNVLCEVLNTESNTQTYLMTVRALRNIWSSYENSRSEILESGAIKIITSLLVRSEKSYESRHAELAETCLKAMCAFIGSLDPRCGMQMNGDSGVEGYKCIVKYCEAKNKLALKCLYSLSQIAECRPSLGSSGAVERLISLVTRSTVLSWEILATLCLFCREAINRARIKHGSGLEMMMFLLKKQENESFHPMILHALSLFMYDDDSIVIMVKNGLLDVLMDNLQKMIEIEKLKNKEEKNGSKKRSRDSSPFRRMDFKYNRTSSGRFSLDYPQDDWSPSSAASTSSSPPSTPPLPLYDSGETDDSAEENYSPVCSDDEWTENHEGEDSHDEVESMKSFISATLDGDECQDTGKGVKTATNEQMNVWTLALLSRLSDSNEPIERLAHPSTIEPLASYIRFARSPRALKILTKITKNRAYLVPLVQQGFVFEAQTLYGSEQYIRQLCALAETGGAVGQFSAILTRGQEANKNIIAVSIPFLIKSREILRNLLYNQGGLQLIFRILADRKHSLHENSIFSISRLADLLDIRPDIISRNQSSVENTFVALDRESFDNLPKPSTVTFVLDDGTTVDACRRILCQKSDAFSAMLEGNFLESGKRRVKLKNTSRECLNTLLLAANGACFRNQTIEELLDAVLLADKFLMADVSEILTESSMSRLNYENLGRAWHWARSNACPELKTFCLKSFLTTKMAKMERLHAFRDFSANDGFSEFVEEIREIVSTVLSQR